MARYAWEQEMLDKAERVAAYTGKAPVIEYDGRGNLISVNGESTATGYVQGRRGSTKAKDKVRGELLDGAEVILSRFSAFRGKTFRHKTEGLVLRLVDADYAIKVMGHSKTEYTISEGFKPEKNFSTRGTSVNHSSLVAKILTSEIENQNLKSISGFENEILICLAKASGIRVQLGTEEYTIKISRKRARVA